jgi:predicted small integral membrane protein
MDILFGRKGSMSMASRLSCVSAEAWFDCYEARRYEIMEQTIRIGTSEILSLLFFEDEEMLEE